ncbi:hypothetical protein A6R68_02689, partial [Neotoma lepida]
ISASSSSQGLSQPSTQTTQYLRADTPNNATPITNQASEVQVTMMLTESCKLRGLHHSIDDTLQVKITDNALSRDLFPMDYHCLGDNENRPWAFGVTLWELMTLGQTPYVDIDPFEMAAYLKDGYRIAQPINCPDELVKEFRYFRPLSVEI